MDQDAIGPAHGLASQPALTRRAFVRALGALGAALALQAPGTLRAAPLGSPPGVQDPVANFVPGEVCLLVSSSRPIVDPKWLYGLVQGWLNTQITVAVQDAPTPPSKDPVEQALDPASLRPYLARTGGGWLRRLNRAGFAPWVVLSRARGSNTQQALLYYQVGVATDTRDELATVVRRLVNLLNLYLGGPRGEDIFQIQAASPNWFVVAASAQTCGGPGGKPEAAPAGDWRLHFADPALEHLREDAAGGPLHPVVAVLDTWPVSVDPLVFPGNWLLQDVASHVHLEPVPPLSVPSTSGASTVLDWYVPPGSSVPALEFGVSDHGLFVAGIVRDLAPAAEVHIYRVLDDCGVGDTLALSSVLERLPRELVGVPGHRPLVVNLSLVVDIPPEIRLFERWYQADRSRYSEKQYRAAWQALDMLAEPITASIDSVVQQGALVVGAAGNDAVPRTKGGPIERTLPRWPAQDPNVLAVAAVQRSGRAASYTNWATKAPGDPTGVAVFGGEGDFLDGWHGPPPTPTAVPFLPAGVYGPRFVPLAGAGGSEGIVGLSVAKVPTLVSCTNPTATPPPPPSTNTAGWVHWAGTSFATPIVSALAANRWATAPGLPPVGYPSVMQAVVSFAHIPVADPAAATPSSRPFGCNMLEVVQA